MLMDEDKIPDNVKQALIDRCEGWEIVDFLNIDTEVIVNTFEDELLDNIEDVLELLGMESEEEDGRND